MIARYLDLATGKVAEESGISHFQLTENNWSCDCNRRIPFEGLREESGECDGCKRFIVYSVEAEPGDDPFDIEETIKEANREYYARLAAA